MSALDILGPLLAAHNGAGGAAPPTGTPGGQAPPAPDHPDSGGGDPLDLLRNMIEDGKSFMDAAPHEQDKATVAQCISILQKLLAQDEAEMHGAMQGKVSPRQIARAAQSQGGGYQ